MTGGRPVVVLRQGNLVSDNIDNIVVISFSTVDTNRLVVGGVTSIAILVALILARYFVTGFGRF